MVTFKKNIFLLLFGVLLTACSTKEYMKQESAFILFKTPTFKYADMGFVYSRDDEIKTELYGSGQALISLTITQNTICFSLLQCMSKKTFNSEVLSAYYPEDLLENVFRGSSVFKGENLVKTRNGFTQKIVKKGKYNIEYNVFNKQILFHDRMNDIMIKIKRIER